MSAFYVAPIRVVATSTGLYSLFYDTTTKEIVAMAGASGPPS
jgi:hypothetical protein